ncbi:hypothetical protein NVP1161O_156 [Vibrio phage 1.161.O._10N.261.48.C5]|nr:hypothetical protein NVP1161O_156 [Vibrio phage 1.161.O._10N.261.48.C5]
MAELKREDLINTKWDVRDWSEEQKVLWQQKCFKLSLAWGGSSITVDHLTATHYFIGQLGLTYINDNDHEYFLRKSSHQEKQFTDMFPNYEAPKPIDVVEEIKQLFVTEMNKEDSDEDERGFEGLVVEEDVIPFDRHWVIYCKELSKDQLNYMENVFNIDHRYNPAVSNQDVVMGDLVTMEMWSNCSENFLPSDTATVISFNDLFKYEDEL